MVHQYLVSTKYLVWYQYQCTTYCIPCHTPMYFVNPPKRSKSEILRKYRWSQIRIAQSRFDKNHKKAQNWCKIVIFKLKMDQFRLKNVKISVLLSVLKWFKDGLKIFSVLESVIFDNF